MSNTESEGGDDGHGYGDYTFLVKQAQPSHTKGSIRIPSYAAGFILTPSWALGDLMRLKTTSTGCAGWGFTAH